MSCVTELYYRNGFLISSFASSYVRFEISGCHLSSSSSSSSCFLDIVILSRIGHGLRTFVWKSRRAALVPRSPGGSSCRNVLNRGRERVFVLLLNRETTEVFFVSSFLVGRSSSVFVAGVSDGLSPPSVNPFFPVGYLLLRDEGLSFSKII